ncbi:DUF1634 domain-containing protein [Mucilaginibacter gracilis]|nr:DUF1634 domain-containing protein [Mucilaginibacter gracilis]
MQKKLNDKDIELLIGSLLRWGVLLSMVVVIIGGSIYLYRHGHDISHYDTFTGQPDFTRQLKAIFEGVINIRGRAIIQFGIILLIATPITRVLLSAISFTIEKDYLYLGISVIVLSIITISMLGGFGG